MDWVFSGLMLVYLWAIGRKLWWGWGVGLIAQVIYFVGIVLPFSLWGLLPLEIIATFLYGLNMMRWYRDS